MTTTLAAPSRPRLPRLGFLGVGWIGRQRMCAVAESKLVVPVAVADPDPQARRQAERDLTGLRATADLAGLLEAGVDAVVIATPSALHADQALSALRHGAAVFCQKPLARSGAETASVVRAARTADLLLGVDLSYRHVRAVVAARNAIVRGDVGQPYAADLAFHNAYGPDKPWFASRRLAGGGCLIDLGTHLVDLLLWLTAADDAEVDSARLLRAGQRFSVTDGHDDVEDLAIAQLTTGSGVTARLACSWHLPVGRDCAFGVTVYGADGAISIENVGGSFYDFRATRCHGTVAEALAEPPDDWGHRAITAWAGALASGARFDPAAERFVTVAHILDAIYGAAA